MLKDIEVNRILGIPVQTLYSWKKKTGNDWRYKVYMLLVKMDKKEISEELAFIQKIAQKQQELSLLIQQKAS